jgi:hypothetical protein
MIRKAEKYFPELKMIFSIKSTVKFKPIIVKAFRRKTRKIITLMKEEINLNDNLSIS